MLRVRERERGGGTKAAATDRLSPNTPGYATDDDDDGHGHAYEHKTWDAGPTAGRTNNSDGSRLLLRRDGGGKSRDDSTDGESESLCCPK